MAVSYADAKIEVEGLVERFARLSARNRKRYNEPATRQEFILPLFRALGWNVEDTREVSPEERVSRGYVHFAFRLGMYIMIREGTTARNLKDLLPLVTPQNARRCMFVTDDRHPAEKKLYQRQIETTDQHIDALVRGQFEPRKSRNAFVAFVFHQTLDKGRKIC